MSVITNDLASSPVFLAAEVSVGALMAQGVIAPVVLGIQDGHHVFGPDDGVAPKMQEHRNPSVY